MLQQMRSRAALVIWSLLFVAFVFGFLLTDASGLLGTGGVTPTTPVATVNGREILYQDWFRRAQQQIQESQGGAGRALSQDEVRQIEDQVLEQMILDILLQEEYERREIAVTDDEIREYARLAPPDFIQNNEAFRTEGQFDPAKYQRYLGSSVARQQGVLQQLEGYYRTEIPRAKLLDQITTGLFITDAELWRAYQDRNDSVRVSFVALRPAADLAADASISNSDLRRYFDAHRDEFDRPGRAVVSLVELPRSVTAADSVAVRNRLVALRNEIASGRSSFEDVARRESSDSASAVDGGSLGRGGRGRFVAPFETAAYALPVGQVSQPVLTDFGYHLIKVDARSGDTLSLRHILLPIRQSDSSATIVDRRADELARLAGGATEATALDSAAKQLGLRVTRVTVNEREPAVVEGRLAPGVSAWAFGGAQVGESSDLFDTESGYFLARLDTLVEGGEPRFERVADEIRMRITRERAVTALEPRAQQLARAAAAGTLEAAAQAQSLRVEQTPPFTRAAFVPGLGQLTRPVGAAFGLPVGAVSAPVKGEDGVYVLRVDAKVAASRQAFEAQKATQRQQQLAQLRQSRVQQFIQDLRRAADVEDRRREINALARRAEG